MSARTLLVGGIGSTHDALLAAALRGAGIPAETIAVPDARALATGRALLAHGHCNPTYYLAGALVLNLRAVAAAEGIAPGEMGHSRAHLTVASCGPCRFATYATEYRRALGEAGFGGVPVAVIDQASPQPSAALAEVGVHLDARLLRALARAVVLGDVLVRAGCAKRPFVADPARVNDVLARVRRDLERALALHRPTGSLLRHLAAELSALPTRSGPPPLRVRVTGELFASTTDGEGSYRLIEWLERHGAVVTPPAVVEWLIYLAWQAAREARGETPPAGDRARIDPARADRLAKALRQLYQRTAAATGVATPIPDMNDLAELAGDDYPPALRGGAGHLEVGAFLEADRDGSADLVVSVKPFGCLPSSAASDGVVAILARRARRCAFVSIETTGDGNAQAESRLELALDSARARRLVNA